MKPVVGLNNRASLTPHLPLSFQLGDAIGDAIDSVKQVASDLKDNLDREVKKNDTLEKFGRSMSELGENIKETTLDISERALAFCALAQEMKPLQLSRSTQPAGDLVPGAD